MRTAEDDCDAGQGHVFLGLKVMSGIEEMSMGKRIRLKPPYM